MAYTIKMKMRRYIINIYHLLSIDKLLTFCGVNDGKINASIKKFKGNTDRKNTFLLRKDIKSCYYKYLTTPDEYFLFGFESNTSAFYREAFLTDNYKIRCLLRTISEEKYVNDLCDKYNFYKISREYFKRDAMLVEQRTSRNEFLEFTKNHKELFIKPLSDSFGRGAKAISIGHLEEVDALYKELSSRGSWIVEERIHQCKETEFWNKSSVNSVRLPCFLSNGQFHVLAPFFRTGRKGAVVDNAGGGGIFACIDPNTGIISSDGVDEMNHYYEKHPDSGLTYRGWEVPQWQELLIMAEKIFRQCFPEHRYIGFDFALTERGWVLIEGNWGQFVSQYNDKVGVKEQFVRYLKDNICHSFLR